MKTKQDECSKCGELIPKGKGAYLHKKKICQVCWKRKKPDRRYLSQIYDEWVKQSSS